jgi:hypothetical protein
MTETFRWVRVRNKDELEDFYRSILPKVLQAARAEGYAIGVHGSLRRDLDLIAVPWIEQHSNKEQLVRAIHRAACGIESESYQWEQKPYGRSATCFPICMPEFDPHSSELSLGHIDLSVTQAGDGCADCKRVRGDCTTCYMRRAGVPVPPEGWIARYQLDRHVSYETARKAWVKQAGKDDRA